MTERATLQALPEKSPVASREGTMSLQWLAWLGALATWVRRVRVFYFAVDVPSIPSGGNWTGTYSLTGVAAGDFVTATLDPTDAGLVVTAQVTAANTVAVVAQNITVGAIDLAAGTIFIKTEKAR